MKFEKDDWRDGHVYDPGSGKTYYAKVTLDKTGNILKLRGSIDKLGVLGITFKAERVSEAEAIKYKLLPLDQLKDPLGN